MVAARNPRWGLVVASLLYVVIGLLLTRPLAWHMNDMLPVDVRDPRLGAWVLWWNAHRLPFTDAWWNAPSFYPAAGTLALSEHLLGLAPLTTPLQWLGASPVLAFNIAFALASPLCAIAAHALVLRLTGRHDAGLVAGLAFGFNPYRAAQLGHLTMLSSYWVPIGLLGLHDVRARPPAALDSTHGRRVADAGTDQRLLPALRPRSLRVLAALGGAQNDLVAAVRRPQRRRVRSLRCCSSRSRPAISAFTIATAFNSLSRGSPDRAPTRARF